MGQRGREPRMQLCRAGAAVSPPDAVNCHSSLTQSVLTRISLLMKRIRVNF